MCVNCLMGANQKHTGTFEASHGDNAQKIAGYLLDGYFEDRGSVTPFNGKIIGDTIEVDISGLTAEGKQLAEWAMDAWEMVSGVDFNVVKGGSPKAEVVIDDNGPTPRVQWEVNDNGQILSATMNVPRDYINRHGSAIDQYAFQTYMHELGHVLGLGHAGNYDGGADYHQHATFKYDSWQLSVMSYFGQDENPNVDASRAGIVTPMEADIIAAQHLYGEPKTEISAGNTTWGLESTIDGYLGDMFKAMARGNTDVFANYAFTMYLHDVGGKDTIKLDKDGRPSRVDLSPGTTNDILGQKNNLIFSDETWIENFYAAGGKDWIRGNKAKNILSGGGNEDTLFGLGGNDVLDGGEGNDKMYGGGGADRMLAGNGEDIVNGHGGDDIIKGGMGIDRIKAGGGDDLVQGDESADFLFGGGGSDEMDGGVGADRIKGGKGNDLLNGGEGADNITGDNGNDELYGGDSTDTLDGGRGRDVLDGGLGDDTLIGGGGADQMNGGALNDSMSGGGGKDKLVGEGGEDLIDGGGGRDHIEAGDMADTVYGGGGNDKIWGGGGGDSISGGGGRDIIQGEDGGDLIDGLDGNDDIFGGLGADTLYGGSGNDLLDGGDLGDTLQGGNGQDRLYGGAAGDNLFGGGGNDILDGGEAGDNMTGGEGADIFVFTDGTDHILDFENDVDTIRLDRDLWGTEPVNVRELLDKARTFEGELMLKFEDSRLVIHNVNNAQSLFNDIELI